MIVSELSTQVNDLLRPMGITRNLSATVSCASVLSWSVSRKTACRPWRKISIPLSPTAEDVSQKRFKALSAGQLKVHGSQTRSMCSSWQAIR